MRIRDQVKLERPIDRRSSSLVIEWSDTSYAARCPSVSWMLWSDLASWLGLAMLLPPWLLGRSVESLVFFAGQRTFF